MPLLDLVTVVKVMKLKNYSLLLLLKLCCVTVVLGKLYIQVYYN